MKSKKIRHKQISGSQSHRTVESRAILYSAFSGAATLIVGLIYFGYVYSGNNVPLFGRMSIGSLSIIMASMFALIGYWLVMQQDTKIDKPSNLKNRWYTIFDNLALSFIHSVIVFLVTSVAFYVLSEAFIGVRIDIYLASVISAATVAASSYAIYLAANNRTALSMSMALAIFLISGAITSMITANDPKWWELHLSSLGANGGLSMYAFNGTLIIGGVVIVGIANQLFKDFLSLHRSDSNYKMIRVHIVRWVLIFVGLFLAGVGLFPYDTMPILHEISAGGMVFLFLFLIGGLQLLVPMFPQIFFAISYAFFVGVLVSTYLFMGVSYFNLTGYEIICFIILFTWLILFVRQISASLLDQATNPLSK